MNQVSLLIALIKYSITGIEPAAEMLTELTSQRLEQVLTLAQKHDVVPMAANALYQLGVLPPDMAGKCQQLLFSASMRYEQLNYDLQKTVKLLEENQIDFIPLKGAVIRKLYPDPWMRTSCDIDILVRDVERAEQVLTANGYTKQGRGSHDVQLRTPGGIWLELHFTLIETDKQVNAVLEHVWERSTPVSPGSTHYVMDDAVAYFYHIAHMAKHFAEGGCGIRFFVDTWLLCTDSPEREDLLHKGGLLPFSANAEKLARMWLAGGAADPLLLEMERFVLDGGALGSRDNQVKVHKGKTAGKAGFLLYRIFMPYSRMRLKYPVLKKWAVLLPVFWVVRWVQLITGNKLKGAVRELDTTDEQQVRSVRWMLQELELD